MHWDFFGTAKKCRNVKNRFCFFTFLLFRSKSWESCQLSKSRDPIFSFQKNFLFFFLHYCSVCCNTEPFRLFQPRNIPLKIVLQTATNKYKWSTEGLGAEIKGQQMATNAFSTIILTCFGLQQQVQITFVDHSSWLWMNFWSTLMLRFHSFDCSCLSHRHHLEILQITGGKKLVFSLALPF